jgi:monoamine oxidase
LGLNVFAQFTKSDLLFEDGHDHIQRGQGFATMEGSLRVSRGLVAPIEALTTHMSVQNKVLNAAQLR